MTIRLEAVYIDKGVIVLIDPHGELYNYAQRGIKQMSKKEMQKYIDKGELDYGIEYIPELPEEYEIYFADEEVMGIASSKFKK